VFSGPKELSRLEYNTIVKKALKPFIAKGASVTPTFISYEKEDVIPSLLLLFGYPKVPEIRDILEEAKALINLHSKGSDIKEHWFKRSKGVTKDVLLTAVNDLEQLFGSYMPTESI
jgi:tRNA pseudouridine-54 N-methylase